MGPRSLARLLACLLALLCSGLAHTAARTAGRTPELGVNLAPVSDYSQTPVFVDVMEQARRFGSPDAPWDENATLGADGWPVGDFGVVLMIGQARVPGTAGRYALSFSGRAQVRAVSSAAIVHPLVYDPVRRRTHGEVELPPGADQLMLRFDQTDGGIKDLHLIRPGYDVQHPPRFTRSFLQQLSPFRTLRLMDWLRTNGNTVQHWSERADPQRQHYLGPNGVPWERAIELANTSHANLWINIPIDADDDYVRQLAQLLQATLDPGLLIYLEYSNEVWNPGFAQFHTNLQRTREELAQHSDSNLRIGGETDTNRMAFRRIARRLMDISSIFRTVFGAQRAARQLRPVLATQAVQPSILQLQLQFLELAYGPPAQHLFGVAIAPYFNLGPHQTEEGLSVDHVLAAMDQSITDLPARNALETHSALAHWYGLQLLAYEGGSDTFGAGSIEAKRAASHDARMLGLCRRYLDQWFDRGGALFMWFHAGAGEWKHRFGTWELSESMTDEQAPKLQCLLQTPAAYRAQEAARNVLPGALDARNFTGSLPPFGKQADLRVRYLRSGQWLDYLVWTPTARSYRISVVAETGQAGNSVQLALDGQSLHDALDLPVSGWGHTAATAAQSITLSAGYHTLRLRTVHESTGFRLDRLVFE